MVITSLSSATPALAESSSARIREAASNKPGPSERLRLRLRPWHEQTSDISYEVEDVVDVVDQRVFHCTASPCQTQAMTHHVSVWAIIDSPVVSLLESNKKSQSINQSSINQSSNQPINQSTINQPINQSSIQPIINQSN